ncbi:DUF6412 domain-containing protein [Frigoribacterium sp. 2-23]|uniref:DUF6412 domain-containing protein n=1 Tax=Frigoribacterium sp. 2-23 TaxID=3415006 RepID=UPI003C6ECD55
MTAALDLLMRLLASIEVVLLGGGGPVSALVLVGLLGAATALVAVGVLRVVLTLCGLAGTQPSVPLRERADTRLLVWNRDPDADGHVRSRAPGRVVTAV